MNWAGIPSIKCPRGAFDCDDPADDPVYKYITTMHAYNVVDAYRLLPV